MKKTDRSYLEGNDTESSFSHASHFQGSQFQASNYKPGPKGFQQIPIQNSTMHVNDTSSIVSFESGTHAVDAACTEEEKAKMRSDIKS